MKGMLNKKTLTLVFLLLFLTLLIGCFPHINQSPIITSTPITLAEVNELYIYEVEATDPDGDSLTYSLDVKPSGMTDTLEVTVNPVLLTSIVVLPEAMTLFVGESETITSVTAHYSNGSTASIVLGNCTYASSAPGVATVSVVGLVEAIAEGTATITVSYAGKTDTVEVTVNPVLLTHIVVLPEAMTLFEEDSQPIDSITAHYNDESEAIIAFGDCAYLSSDDLIATIVNGNVTAVTFGTAIITVSYTPDGMASTDTIDVTVKVPIVIDGTLSLGEWDDYFWFTDNEGNEYFGGVPEFTYYKTNDSDYLYFATIVDDPTPLEESNDDIWLAFRLDAGDDYKVFRKGYETDPAEFGQLSETGAYGAYGSLPEGVEFGWSIDDSHIYYEWKIPLTLLNIEPGETIKYLTHVREWSVKGLNYHPEATSWAPYGDIEQFGDLTLD